VYFVLGQIEKVKVVLPQFLKMAQIFIADRMTLAKGRTLEFAGPNLGNIVDKFRTDSILQFNFFQHY
jgi:hypothetical protein